MNEYDKQCREYKADKLKVYDKDRYGITIKCEEYERH